MNPLLQSLNDAQRQAASHVEGPMLVLAGPGSGKTRVITHRVAHLISEGIHEGNILALTFTNKAADEMKIRIEQLAEGRTVWVSTFHRFCSRLLRQHASLVGLRENFTIYDSSDSRRMLARTLEETNLSQYCSSPDRVASIISSAKNRMVGPDDFRPRVGHPTDELVAKAYPEYQKRLLNASAVDFDDLLLHVARLLQENPELRASLDDRFRYVMVDEYQDTNLVQYAIIRALSINHPNLAVTGDPDQSIYGWRGANLNNILDFEADFDDVRVVRLERNYRSSKSILRVADSLIQRNVRRKAKGLFTENDEGVAVRLVTCGNQDEEAASIAEMIRQEISAGRRRARDFAILYRMNALSRTLEKAFVERGIPYQMLRGLEFYQRKEIKDVLAYLGLINNPRDDVAFLRIINTPSRKIGKTTLSHLQHFAMVHGLTLLEAARHVEKIEAISKRSAAAVKKFVTLQDELAQVAMQPVEEILGHVLELSGYQADLKESKLDEDLDRLANIEELLTAAQQFDELREEEGNLEAFLEQSALVNDTDAFEADDDRVSLMTLHAAKGLEFPVIFIIAVEEGVLPHERSKQQPDQLEEERRLLFVGITRAEEELHLSYAVRRNFRGRQTATIPSIFLMELPRHEMEVIQPAYERVYDPYEAYPADEYETPYQRDEEEVEAETAIVAPLRTAAAMNNLAPAESPAVSADNFHQNMVVTHPEYGPGRIIALSGQGRMRRATVAFPAAGQKKFVLEKSPLRPAPK